MLRLPPRAAAGGGTECITARIRTSGGGPAETGPSDGGSLMKGLETLKIEHNDPKLLITDSLGREHVLYTDGRKIEEQSSSGGVTIVRAQWMDGHVVVRWEPEHGPTVTETFSAAADGKQLTLVMHLEGKGRLHDVTIRRIYDASTAEPQSHPSPGTSSPGDP